MNFEILIKTIKNTHFTIQQSAAKSVIIHLTITNWLVGYYIVSFEQNGDDKAKYGNKVIVTLCKNLNIKGLAETNLKQCRKFYLIYPQISQSVSDLLESRISQMPSDKLLFFKNLNQ